MFALPASTTQHFKLTDSSSNLDVSEPSLQQISLSVTSQACSSADLTLSGVTSNHLDPPLNLNYVPIERANKNDSIIHLQLHELARICKDLSDQTKATKERLISLSWGVARLPSAKKFSAVWSRFVDEHLWLLLEDISRQITAILKRNSSDTATIDGLVNQFCQTAAKPLEDLFVTLGNWEAGIKITFPEKPQTIQNVKLLFSNDFDQFVLSQVNRCIQTVIDAVGSQNPADWLLANDNHVKAFFRTIEVIGEASKILSAEVRKFLPILHINDEAKTGNNLWGKLRNSLHHDKDRTWNIAKLAPKMWADLIPFLQAIQCEIINQRKNVNLNEVSEELNWNSLTILCKLSKEDFLEDLKKMWENISTDFASEPCSLKLCVFGLKNLDNDNDFYNVWENHAKPFLKPEINQEHNQVVIFELLRRRKGMMLLGKEIQELNLTSDYIDKKTAIARMIQLLKELTLDNKETCGKSFNQLADGLVFLKKIEIPVEKEDVKKTKLEIEKNEGSVKTEPEIEKNKGSVKTKLEIERDSKKNESIKKLVTKKISSLKPFQIAETVFKNNDGSLSEYGLVLEAYVKLKYVNIQKLFNVLKGALQAIKASWPDDFEDKTQFPKTAGDLKNKLVANIQMLSSEIAFIQAPSEFRVSTLQEVSAQIKVFKVVPAGNQLNQNLVEIKEKSFSAIESLSDSLALLSTSESYIRQVVEERFSMLNKLCKLKCNDASKNLELVNEIFNLFAFKGTKDFIEDLNKAEISHNFDLVTTPSLNSLRMKVVSSLEVDIEEELKKIATEAQNELNIEFVQKVLSRSEILIFSEPKLHIKARENIALLEKIYFSGLDKNEKDYAGKKRAWENVKRKVNGRRLGAEEIALVQNWIETKPSADNENIINELFEYLNGIKEIPLNDKPRFERGYIKVDEFNSFLERCIQTFHELKVHRDQLIRYFKIANRIQDNQDKVERFVKSFERKITKLGDIFAQFVTIEQEGKEKDKHIDLLLLSAEYDLQDVGELAQLIKERPKLWNQGRHLLSSRHLLLISLMRKMMAHYPLSLPQEVLRWNIEYLAFDTKNVLSGDSKIEFYPDHFEMQKSPTRRPIIKVLETKLSEINRNLGRLSLKTDESDILFPLLSSEELPYLHPFGELAMLVYPASKVMTKVEFTHNVMQLELILKHELDCEITVIGNWDKEENDLVNIPFVNHIPEDYLKKLIKQKQGLVHWIKDNKSYELLLTGEWTEVLFKSGRTVTRSDHNLYEELTFFLKELVIPEGSGAFQKFINKTDLCDHIFKTLKELHLRVGPNDQRDTLHRWIRCLFERFCPPEAKPSGQVYFPPSYKESRPFITMVDENGVGLRFLPLKRALKDRKTSPYYREDGSRLDVYKNHSFIDEPHLINPAELKSLAEYASKVLKAHVEFVLQKTHPEYSLKPSHFKNVDRIRFDDPALVEKPKEVNTIDSRIEALIENEARQLAPLILELVQPSVNLGTYVIKYCREIFLLLRTKMEIAQIARNYFEKHRLRLMRPYIEMDQKSKAMFCRLMVVLSQGHIQYPFVVSFTKFLDRIEKVPSEPNNALEDLSLSVKGLIPDKDVQKTLLVLVRRYQQNWMSVQNAGIEGCTYMIQHSPSLLSNFLDEIEKISKYPTLFRMVHSCKVLDALLNYISQTADKRSALIKIEQELKLDFEVQYKNSSLEQEAYEFESAEGRVCLYDPRTYFDGKNNAEEAKQYNQKIRQMGSTPAKIKFCSDWARIYGETFKYIYISNPHDEVRNLLSSLVQCNNVPNYDFDTVLTYSQYWTFVSKNSVEITTLSKRSGILKSYVDFISEGGNLNEIPWYRENKTKKENTRTCKLLEGYIPFYPLESQLSSLAIKLISQVKDYDRILQEMGSASGLANSFKARQYEGRLGRTKRLIEEACNELENTLDNIIASEFFKMLKLAIVLESLVENKVELSEEEQANRALQCLLLEYSLTSEDIQCAFDIAGTMPKNQFILFCIEEV